MQAATLNSVLRKVLSVGNKESNQMYPPHIYEEHFNTVTQFIIDECVRLYPTNTSIQDVIRPFLMAKFDRVINGVITLPRDYRNFIGAAINLNNTTKEPCGECNDKLYRNDPLVVQKDELDRRVVESGCFAQDISMLDRDEFNRRTTHSYKKPTLQEPIGVFSSNNTIKICPFDISHAEVYYIRKPKEYKFGYKMNPDDTYSFDPATSTESEWDDTAMQYLVKGISSLYAIYTRDGEMRDWNVEIKRIGLF